MAYFCSNSFQSSPLALPPWVGIGTRSARDSNGTRFRQSSYRCQLNATLPATRSQIATTIPMDVFR